MNESDYNQLKEKSWRRTLTAGEEAQLRAWLAEHPEAGADWETEIRLTDAMKQLPDATVPSNFTARVLQAVERETATAHRPRMPALMWVLRSLMPRVAVAAVVLGVGLISYHRYEMKRRAELVHEVKVVAGVPSLPSPEILQDFETIRRMGATPGPDPELIALLK